jgi:hypothetical protein
MPDTGSTAKSFVPNRLNADQRRPARLAQNHSPRNSVVPPLFVRKEDYFNGLLSPLTVFCGSNSSGKSTILKIFPLVEAFKVIILIKVQLLFIN